MIVIPMLIIAFFMVYKYLKEAIPQILKGNVIEIISLILGILGGWFMWNLILGNIF